MDAIRHLLSRRPGAVLIFAVLVFALGYWSRSLTLPSAQTPAASAAGDDASETWWTCSMHPQIRQPRPGKCPICAMDLIPVAPSAGGLRTLSITPEARALMNVQTTPVERKYVSHDILLAGKVDYDETRLGYITAWVAGRLDRMYVDFTGIGVKKGDHMVYIYSEELYTAQQELIQAIKFAGQGSAADVNLVESAREKLRLLGMTAKQIEDIEKQKKPSDHITIYAPMTGIVIEKHKQQGDRVRLGERIYTIADLSKVWVHLDAYESDLPWLRYGQQVTLTTESYPGRRFEGKIAFIQPVLDDRTRTVKVRVNVDNRHGLLKPAMLVHASVRADVAAGGKVMNPDLAGKWISPMHPEIVKDHPGKCDICGMDLVRAEELGYVPAVTEEWRRPLVLPFADLLAPTVQNMVELAGTISFWANKPLVIPASAPLITGKRAVVYVELPSMPDGIETAFQGISHAVEHGQIDDIRGSFSVFVRLLNRPYGAKGTPYARQLWEELAGELSREALQGMRASTSEEAQNVFTRLTSVMERVRERFAPPHRPTFEGREIVLGPRAGNYYLIRHGLKAGELVVTQGNFKIDSEIQIQAKPSMMTPEGGGSAGHAHGPQARAETTSQAQHSLHLPAGFLRQVLYLDDLHDRITQAFRSRDLKKVKRAFAQFKQAIADIEDHPLTGHPRMLWKELAMLLGNDAAEGEFANDFEEADHAYLSLQKDLRRLKREFNIRPGLVPEIKRIEVDPAFQAQLGKIWQTYLPVQAALAGDSREKAQRALPALQAAIDTVESQTLSHEAEKVWQHEKATLTKAMKAMSQANDLEEMRVAFAPLSESLGRLAKTFGFGPSGPVYEIRCSMALKHRGATWLQNNNKVRNPYFGASMLRCADETNLIWSDKDQKQTKPEHQHNH
ncbi:MAG: hypothetical protein KatS3mg105_2559 [Gemmatales bacterium]|nr:MAG: hypothetical protein KatS3mg105_2559 [Gemmatales bacterium]